MYVDHSRSNKVDKSGSCAIVTFFYGNKCYIANVGDSRAVIANTINGKDWKIIPLSDDQKPSR